MALPIADGAGLREAGLESAADSSVLDMSGLMAHDLHSGHHEIPCGNRPRSHIISCITLLY